MVKDQLVENYKAKYSGNTSEKAQEEAYVYLKTLENQYGYGDDELNEVSKQFLEIQGLNKNVYDTGNSNAALDYLYGVDTKIEYQKNYKKAEKKVNQYVQASNQNGKQNDEFAAKIIFDAQNDGLKIRDLNALANRLAGDTGDKEQSNSVANQNLYKYMTWKDPEITALDEIDAFVNSFGSGLTDSLKGISTSLMKVVGAGDLAPKDWQQPTWQQKKINDVKEQTGLVGDFLLDVSYGAGNMAPSLVANAVLPGSGLAVTFVGSAGQSYNQAIMEGHSETEATTYALLNAGLNTATEKMFGFLGKGTGKNLTTSLEKFYGNAFNKAISNQAVASGLTKFFSNGSGEFVEELAQQIISPAISEISFEGDQGAYDHPLELASNAVYSSLVSFFAGGIGGTISEGIQGVRVKGTPQIDGRNFANIGAQTDVRSASASIADTDMNAQNSIAAGQAAIAETNATVKTMTDLTGQFNKVRSTGETLGVSDRNIRLGQDLALITHRDVMFTDGPTGIGEDGGIQINKDSSQPMNEVAEMIIDQGQGKSNAKVNADSDENSQPVHTYESLSNESDENLNKIHEDTVKRYADDLRRTGRFSEDEISQYQDEALKPTSREETVKHIVNMQGEMNGADLDVNGQWVENNDSGTGRIPNVASEENANPRSVVDQADQSLYAKEDLTSNSIQKMLADKKIFSDQQLDNMNERQLYHVLRTLSFDYEGKIPDIYGRVLSFKDSGDVDGMKGFVKELQGGRANNMVLQSGGDSGKIQIKWDSWQNYEKIIVNGQQYAKVGNRLYSRHAVDRMQPSGNRFGPYIYQAGGDYGRSILFRYKYR